MVSGGKTVGVRMPNLDTALKIIEAAGGLLPTTSANISGKRHLEVMMNFQKSLKKE